MTNKMIPSATALAMMATLSTAALATPTYNGPTGADFGTNPGAASSNDAGYYIWSSNEGNDWSVRWTGNAFGDSGWYDWFGTINLQNLTDGSVQGIQFEGGHIDNVGSYVDVGGPLDVVTFEGYAGPAYDGFDFSLTNPSSTQVIDFSLGTTLVTGLVAGTKDVAGKNIFIGSDFSTPLVQIQDYDPTNSDDNRLVQRFEVTQVPEPGTFALMGLGLLGLGLRLKKRSA